MFFLIITFLNFLLDFDKLFFNLNFCLNRYIDEQLNNIFSFCKVIKGKISLKIKTVQIYFFTYFQA